MIYYVFAYWGISSYFLMKWQLPLSFFAGLVVLLPGIGIVLTLQSRFGRTVHLECLEEEAVECTDEYEASEVRVSRENLLSFEDAVLFNDEEVLLRNLVISREQLDASLLRIAHRGECMHYLTSHFSAQA